MPCWYIPKCKEDLASEWGSHPDQLCVFSNFFSLFDRFCFFVFLAFFGFFALSDFVSPSFDGIAGVEAPEVDVDADLCTFPFFLDLTGFAAGSGADSELESESEESESSSIGASNSPAFRFLSRSMD